jgi:hypothetical protein
MVDELRRSSLGPLFLAGGILLLVLVVVALVPLWTCPQCEVLNGRRAVFVPSPACKGCDTKGRVSLLRRWRMVQVLRGNGLNVRFLPS